MKETNFQRILIKSLRECGATVFNIHGHAMQVAGIPDLYVAHKIWSGWLELKCGNNPPTKLQSHTLKKLNDSGVEAYILVEDKPRMILRKHSMEIVGYIPLLSNSLDGIEFLNKLALVVRLNEAGIYELQVTDVGTI